MKIKAFVLLLFVLGGVPFALTSYKLLDNDKSASYEMVGHLMTLQNLDAKTNELLLRSRLLLDKNYDALASIEPRVAEIHGQIEKRLAEVPDRGIQSFSDRYKSYLDARENKSAIVENFKSHNSILRNSIRYAPEAIDEFAEATSEAGVDFDYDLLYKLKANLQEYALTGRQTAKVEIMLDMPILKKMGQNLPDAVAIKLSTFQNHVTVILEEKDITTKYLQQAITSRTNPLLTRLMEVLENDLLADSGRGSEQLLWLSVYFGALMLVLLFFVVSLFRVRPQTAS